MTKKIVKGDELMVFKDEVSIGLATSHTLTITGNTIDINHKDLGYFGASEVGNITWEATAEHLYSEYEYDMLFNMMIAKTKFELVFGYAGDYDKDGLGSKKEWNLDDSKLRLTGKAYISSLVANANTGENSTFSVTFTGVGSLNKNTVVDGDTNRSLMNVLYNAGLTANSDYATREELANITQEQFDGISNNLKSVSDLTSLQYMNKVTTFHESQFENSSIQSVVFPPSISETPRYLFRYSRSLNSLTFNEGITIIRMASFRDCNLTSVVIPSSVRFVQSVAFTMNPLTSIRFESTTPPSFSSQNTPWDNVSTLTVYVPSTSIEAYRTALAGQWGDDAFKFAIVGY